MADVYAAIAEADPRQQVLRSAYLADLALPEGAHVLDIGCGTGPVTRSIAGLERVKRTVGLDPSPTLLEHARRLSAQADIAFHQGDARRAWGRFKVRVATPPASTRQSKGDSVMSRSP